MKHDMRREPETLQEYIEEVLYPHVDIPPKILSDKILLRISKTFPKKKIISGRWCIAKRNQDKGWNTCLTVINRILWRRAE